MTQNFDQVAVSASIYGCAGPALDDRERAFFQEARPFGFILFKRNIHNAQQLRALTAALRACVGWNAPILIDQEGGRVARLRPPLARRWASVGSWVAHVGMDCTEEALQEALWLRYRLIADELISYGIDVNCAPLADLRLPGADLIIGDRALGAHPSWVAQRAQAVMAGLLAGGVLPVLKHLPGHGRAPVDSHVAAPRVSASRSTLAVDFEAFKPLITAPLGMTAHVIYEAIDADHVATVSSKVIGSIIREHIGFQGALMSDDLAMGALEGKPEKRAQAALEAGCDLVLHCSGILREMTAIAEQVPVLSGAALARVQNALAARQPAEPFDKAAAEARLKQIGFGRYL